LEATLELVRWKLPTVDEIVDEINPYWIFPKDHLLNDRLGTPGYILYIYIEREREQLTHILEDLTHKMEGHPPKKRGQLVSRYIYMYIYI